MPRAPDPEQVLRVVPPAGEPAPVVLDSPHSGTLYPEDFEPAVGPAVYRRAEDAFVDELFADGPSHGATLLHALFPRVYIDPNRAQDDIDPDLLDGEWPGAMRSSDKSAAGTGLLFRLVGPEKVALYRRKLTVAEAQHRIEHYWRPYHLALRRALDEAVERFGCVFHLNCHSTPSIWGKGYPKAGQRYEQHYTLGDRDGSTANERFTGFVRDVLADKGFTVAVNDGQKGVELVRAYSDPRANRHSLQIEIRRDLYMDEARFERNEGFAGQQRVLGELVEALCTYARSQRVAGR